MKIGKLVRTYIDAIFAYCEKNPDELSNLMDEDYSKQKFGIYFPFCMEVESIPPEQATGKQARFWVRLYSVQGKTVRVCSQWYERNRESFVGYMAEKKIVNDE